MGGETRKQYLRLRGVPVIDRTLQVIVDSDLFDRVIVVVPPEDLALRRKYFADAFAIGNRLRVVAGG